MTEDKSVNEVRQGREGRRAFTILHLSLLASCAALGLLVLIFVFAVGNPGGSAQRETPPPAFDNEVPAEAPRSE